MNKNIFMYLPGVSVDQILNLISLKFNNNKMFSKQIQSFGMQFAFKN